MIVKVTDGNVILPAPFFIGKTARAAFLYKLKPIFFGASINFCSVRLHNKYTSSKNLGVCRDGLKEKLK